MPRQLWVLPIAEARHPSELVRIRTNFPDDIGSCTVRYEQAPSVVGNPYLAGEYIDEWGCRFLNVQPGVIGEVKRALVPESDENWEDTSAVHIPVEQLTFSIDEANAFCRASDRFVLSGCCPRIFEQLQFIRGTEQLYREVFKPLYRDYADIARRAGKKLFMHSDGYILDIYPDLIEIGVDAVNSQLFCMGIDALKPYKGRITFWGEIDRQHLLPYASPDEIRSAVEQVYGALWQDGGCIAQCEFGAGARPENVQAVFEAWDGMRQGQGQV